VKGHLPKKKGNGEIEENEETKKDWAI